MRTIVVAAGLVLATLLPMKGLPGACRAQTMIRGSVVERDSHMPIIGATILCPSLSGSRTTTDSLGVFSLVLAAGPATIVIESEGYRTMQCVVQPSDSLIVFALRAIAYDLDEVIVTTSRLPQTVLSSPSAVSIINRLDIDRSHGGSVADVLSSETGLFLKDYGAPSALKTVSQRGLGMEHTLLLLNGAPMNSIQNGIQDLGVLSLGEIERIEVIQGGQSASFGANAVAGVINLISREGGSVQRIQGSTSFGSFGERRLHVAAEFPASIGSIRASLHDEQSSGEYPFWWNGDGGHVRLLRRNSDLSSRGVSLSAMGWVFSGVRTSLLGSYQKSDRGVAGPVVSATSTARARQSDENGIVQGSAMSLIGESTRISLKVHYEQSYQRYTDPDIVVAYKPLDNYYVVRRLWMEQTTNVNFSGGMAVLAGIDGTLAWAESNALNGDPRQTHYGAFAVGNLYLSGSRSVDAGFLLTPALRLDVVAKGSPTFSPQLGALWTPEGFTAGVLGLIRPRIRGSVSRNFRTPTFNELYFNGGGGIGNPDLVPEHSTSFELGGGVSLSGVGEHHLDVTYFRIGMENRIVWTGGGGGVVRPKNLRNVLSQGMEFRYRGSLPQAGLTFTAEYCHSQAEKRSPDYPGDPIVGTQLVYAPREKLAATAGYSADVDAGALRRVSLTLAHIRVGYRYVTEDNVQYLPSYDVTNFAIRGDVEALNVQFFTRVEIENLFNEDYQVFLGYPMPLRSYRLTLGATY